MYVIKYALKSIRRSIGRNILIGIIVFIIAVSACVAMSIQQAAETAAATALEGMNITGQINIDRDYVFQKASENVDPSDQQALMSEVASLNKEYEEEYGVGLDDMDEYCKIKKSGTDESIVKDYYYSDAVSIDGKSIEKYDLAATTQSETTAADTSTSQTGPDGNTPAAPQAPQAPEQPEQSGDFSLIGYSSREAMEDFGEEGDDSICTLQEGEIFEDNTSEYVCLVEDSLATFNNLSVGDTITLVNPKNDKETYDLKVVGIYNNSSNTSTDGVDPANTIITSYAVVKDIESKSEKTNASSGSDDEESNELIGRFTGTFVFGSVDDYYQFKDEVKAKAESNGLDGDLYIVTSSGIATFKAGLKPLENLKSFATTFLYLTLAIGAVVLIVISVISIRDRKYEIGALAAMGMKKLKLAFMFLTEVLTVTLIAILIGAAIGSVASVPVTNYLLTEQVEQQEENDDKQQSQQGPGNQDRPEDGEVKGNVTYVTEVGFSVDFMVILKMLLIGIGLSVVSGFTSILFILRYDPKQILANRD